MDEGLTTFATARVLEMMGRPTAYQADFFGGLLPWAIPGVGWRRDREGDRFFAYRELATADSQSTASFRLLPGSGGALSYAKTALWLHTLERLLGWEMLQRILSTYYQRFAFRHASPEDFFAVATEVSGRDLSWFFDQVYAGTAAFDYGIERFTSDRIGDGTVSGYRTQVLVRRYQDGVFPVDVRVVLESGEEIRWEWDGRERWKLFDVERPAAARLAEVDPDRVLLLDLDAGNNASSRSDTGAGSIARRWSAAWLVWAQDRLLTYGFLF
jgi:hypothetical protein